MKRKSIIIAAVVSLVAVVVIGGALFAAGQTGFGCHHKAGFMKALNLTDAQKTQVKSIFQEAKTKAQAVRNDASLTAEQKKAQIRDTFKGVREQIAQILTPEQKQKLDQFHKGMHRGEHRAFAALNLTDTQKTQVKAIFQDAKTKVEAVRADKSLTTDQAKAKVMEIRKASFEKVKQILTPEQIQKMEQMKAQGHHRCATK